MKNIIFIGETRDFSDRWLISVLKKYHNKVTIVNVKTDETLKFPQECDIVINRLYTSSIQRFKKEKVLNFVRVIYQFEQQGTAIINFSKGYELDISREKQSDFFRKKKVPFIETLNINRALSDDKRSLVFPYVLKYNLSGRNKTLQIIRDKDELLSLPKPVKERGIIQPLIKKSVCYRTEFVGNWYSTFTQHIDFRNDNLSFDYTRKIISTPLSESFRKSFCGILNEVGVQVFSIEYFMEKNNLLKIIDFNLTSNYPDFFIKKVGNQLKKAWLNLIKNATI